MPIVLYSGSIGEKQGLEALLETAYFFQKENIKVQFVIGGSGPYKNNLEILAVEKKIANVTFLPLQSAETLNSFLNIADVHLVIQKANVAHHVMPSKLTSILAVGGLVIVTANKDSGIYKMIAENNLGLLCPAENIPALSETIKNALHENHLTICNNARGYAEKYLSIDIVMEGYLNEVMQNEL